VGHLALVHSDSELDYSVVPIPIAVLNGGEGPTVLLTAGTHGDEYEGQVLLHELARTQDPVGISGRLIVLPALNLPAVQAATRTSPLDGANLNRAYPGDPDGSPTSAIADYVTRQLLPHCDFAADLHSGGRQSQFLPSGFMTRTRHGRFTAAQAAALRAMGMPYSIVYDEETENRAIDTACDRAGVVMVATELSGGAQVRLATLAAARVGLRRMLVHWGVLQDDTLPPSPGTRFIDVNDARSSVMAEVPGLFEPVVSLGDRVHQGDIVGRLFCVDDLAVPARTLTAPMSGILHQRRVPTLVRRGSIVCSIGTDLDMEG
jgi:predicted deacylase